MLATRPAARPISPGEAIDVMGSRWALQILIALLGGQMRFSDLEQALPRISAKILTVRLRELEAAMLVARDHLPPPAASHVYMLSPMADDLRPALEAFENWQTNRAATRRGKAL